MPIARFLRGRPLIESDLYWRGYGIPHCQENKTKDTISPMLLNLLLEVFNACKKNHADHDQATLLSLFSVLFYYQELVGSTKSIKPMLTASLLFTQTHVKVREGEICFCSYNISFWAQKQFRLNWDSSSREYAMKMLSTH